jgi:hypothetical protein
MEILASSPDVYSSHALVTNPELYVSSELQNTQFFLFLCHLWSVIWPRKSEGLLLGIVAMTWRGFYKLELGMGFYYHSTFGSFNTNYIIFRNVEWNFQNFIIIIIFKDQNFVKENYWIFGNILFVEMKVSKLTIIWGKLPRYYSSILRRTVTSVTATLNGGEKFHYVSNLFFGEFLSKKEIKN